MAGVPFFFAQGLLACAWAPMLWGQLWCVLFVEDILSADDAGCAGFGPERRYGQRGRQVKAARGVVHEKVEDQPQRSVYLL